MTAAELSNLLPKCFILLRLNRNKRVQYCIDNSRLSFTSFAVVAPVSCYRYN